MAAQKLHSLPKRIAEITALDWIPIVFSAKAFPSNPRPSSERRKQIETQIISLEDSPVEELVANFRKALEEEEHRRNQIESKANGLLGFTAIALSFIVGFAQLLLQNEILPRTLLYIVITLYVLIALSLLITIILARRAITIATFQKPRPAEYLDLRNSTRDHFYRQLAASLLQAYENNQAVVNDKATYVIGAQDWFRNTLLLFVALVIALSVGIVNIQNTGGYVRPAVVITPTPNVVGTPSSTTQETPKPSHTVTSSPLSSPAATGTPFINPRSSQSGTN